jgi:phage pi2 protein 07
MRKHAKHRVGVLVSLAIVLSIGLSATGQFPEFATAQVAGTEILYTLDADFDQGTLVSVNHAAPFNNQLQLDQQTKPFPFINIAASGRGTIIRANTETGQIVGEFRSAPEGRGLNPSRTTVDLFGNVWTANRDEAGAIGEVLHGSAVKIGLIVGGARVEADGTPNLTGGYLKPPYDYNQCIDRNGDGLIRTSQGLGDILDWPDITDGLGGPDGLVQDAVDECIVIYQRLPDAENARHVSVDADNNVWVGGYPFQLRMFYKLDGASGAILDSFDARAIGCGGYGGLIDGNGILWSTGGPLLRYDPQTNSGFCINQGGYGLSVDSNGFIWMSLWDGGIVKIAPDGTVQPGFPKPTYLLPPIPLAGSSSLQEAGQPPSTAPERAGFAAAAPTPGRAVPAGDRLVASRASDAQYAQANSLTDSVPAFQVAPVDEWVVSNQPWTPGATISLSIEAGGVVVYTDSQSADAFGNFNFNLWNRFDLQRGQVVTVSDGVTTKTHTVANLFVATVNTAADTISGKADPGATVDVWVHGDGGLTAIADGAGDWTADFSAQTDLTYLSDGGSGQADGDGDATMLWWSSPRFWVAPADHWVQSRWPWTLGATISLTIEDGGAVVYSDSQVTDGDGNFNFDLWNLFDLKRGQVVTVSDGTTTKTHTVTNLYVDGVNIAADTVFGRAAAGTDVQVWVHGDGEVLATADGSGNWTADFSAQTDLTAWSDGGSQQEDADGDSTGVWWSNPRFQVAPDDDWVGSDTRWTEGATISLTIEDGGAVVYSDSQTADANGNFNFNLWDIFDLQRGQVVTVSDGLTTKTHTVKNLYVDGVNVLAETVFGRAAAGTDVQVWVHGDGDLFTSADGSGNWTADFSAQTDLTYFSDGGSRQNDDDGDSTGVWWASPRFQLAPDDDWVGSDTRWTPGATISLFIEDGGAVVYSNSQTADAHGNFNFNLWDIFDLQRGQVVTVSDGTNTKTHTVMDLYVDGVSVTADTIFGRSDAGTDVQVWVHGDGEVFTSADGSGNWTADFSAQTDLTYLSDGGSRQNDDDGDSTGVWWAAPRFQLAPDEDWVQSSTRWTPGATISLTIEDGGMVVYSDAQTSDAIGNFNFNLWGIFNLQRGQVVTVSDGTNTKTHTVMNLFVDGVNAAADTVFGRVAAGTDVQVWVHGDGNVSTTADGSGHWTADFSAQSDLTYLSDGGSQTFDGDGDSTGVWWSTLRFQAAPDDDWVGSYTRWTPGATISLTIEDGGAVVYSDTQTADWYGNFTFNLGGIFDLQIGQVVTVSDGTTTKTHTINDGAVTNLDTVNDLVQGTSHPFAIVNVWAGLFGNGSERIVAADSNGDWLADFSAPWEGRPAVDITGFTTGNTTEFDDDGDGTYRLFGAPAQQNRGVAITSPDNHVWVASSAPGTVTRLDNDGNILKIISTGNQPTGVAVDAAGKVWATNLGSDNAVRIDPVADADGLGAVDLTVDLGPGAGPYNYSDMTGAVVVGFTSPQGFWSVIQDSAIPGFEWGRVTWNNEPEGNVPAGADIVVEARTADTQAGLGGQAFQPVGNGVLFSMFGRFIEVRATLKSSPEGASPVLSDLRIQPHVIYVGIDIKPLSYPNSVNCKNRTETISVAILTTPTFDALTVDHTTVTFEGAQEIHTIKKTKIPLRHIDDADLDGDLDLVFHFLLVDTSLTCSSTAGTLYGLTYSGIPIEGTDSIRMLK